MICCTICNISYNIYDMFISLKKSRLSEVILSSSLGDPGLGLCGENEAFGSWGWGEERTLQVLISVVN